MVTGVVMCCCFEPRVVVVHGKRMLRSLFWRVRADIRRQMKARSNKNSFNYDPFSYSLNFDNDNFGFFC
ncbi:hypothetical protein E2542_SST22181 [Spatholobus suberectus]|nr:hypothetical protein E2542_SST22181 [Spatholobus suberectus]